MRSTKYIGYYVKKKINIIYNNFRSLINSNNFPVISILKILMRKSYGCELTP